MNLRGKRTRRILVLALVVSLLVIPTAAFAEGHGGDHMHDMPEHDYTFTGNATPPPAPIMGPRLDPTAISHSDVLDPYVIYNNLLVPPGLPVQSIEADVADGGRDQEEPGRGVRQLKNAYSEGTTLFPNASACNNFNNDSDWASLNERHEGKATIDVWTDWYGGWGPFAINDGHYQAKNVTFSIERVIGPGEKASSEDNYAAKIGSNQPYAAGFGSPIIHVPPYSEVTVSAKYLIWDHDFQGLDYDWASLGVKPDAHSDGAVYVNGYTRGEWWQMNQTVWAGGSGEIMVLLQAHSPGAWNSNIYFDDVIITYYNPETGQGGVVADCKLAK